MPAVVLDRLIYVPGGFGGEWILEVYTRQAGAAVYLGEFIFMLGGNKRNNQFAPLSLSQRCLDNARAIQPVSRGGFGETVL